MRDLVNFILRCTGDDLELSEEQVVDVDHAPEHITELQAVYIAHKIPDYPLISKEKKYRAFQPVLEEFFAALIQTFHHSSILYTDVALLENIQIWMSTISTAGIRPFRHTATIISLAMTTALCGIAREVTTTVTTSRKQLESEKKKKNVNKGRVEAIQTAISEGETKIERLDDFLHDGFDTVFVHRYRDVDGVIRGECLASLGRWIATYREMFFEGQYLRYLGWTLADVVAHTRLVVLTQLLPLFENKDNIAVLHSFTDRFRPRIVEIAAQDADINVRVAAIELLNHLREGGLLEPDDIDAIGKLVFDIDPRIRKTAGRFFVANVQDAFEASTEEVADEMNDIFADDDDDDEFETPKRSWIKYKNLVDIFQAYDNDHGEEDAPEQTTARGVLSGAPADSRFVLATEAIYPHMEELSQWQSLAGYLLYDHSQIEDEPEEDDTAGVLRTLYKMNEGQESILLEILCAAVKLRVLNVAKSDIDKRGRKVKALTAKIPELQEEISHGLAQIIPQLLNKFGSAPEAASAVLRLEHLVDLDTIQDLQKDATAYTSLLNDINKQFLTHSDQDVLAEASVAFLHAKSSEEMREALEGKVQELWDDMIDTLGALSRKKEVQAAAYISDPTITELANTVTRIFNLSTITDCTTILETVPKAHSKSKKDTLEAPFNTLIHLTKRGIRKPDEDEDIAKAESEVVVNSIRTLLFYFMWKVQALTATLKEGKASFTTSYFESLTKSREIFASALLAIMQKRAGLDDLRFTAVTTYLDLHTLFGTLRNIGQGVGNDEEVLFQAQSLVHEVPSEGESIVAKIQSSAERIFAKKSNRDLEPAEDDAPASEDEPEDDDEASDSDDDAIANERLRSSMIAEQRLCELTGKLVLAIIGRVIDASGSKRGSLKKRLLHNKNGLGQNYREVLSYLEERKPRSAPRSKGKQSAKADAGEGEASTTKKDFKSAERIDDDEDEEDGDDADPVEEDDEEDLRTRGLVAEDIDRENDENEELDDLAPESDEDEVMGD
jgi:cohesin complex subunit SA-1/2